nr:MAG TPA: hypothetical protein [Caudoviricetes sp.]
MSDCQRIKISRSPVADTTGDFFNQTNLLRSKSGNSFLICFNSLILGLEKPSSTLIQ